MSLDSNQTSRPVSASAIEDTDPLESGSSPSCVSWITWNCSLPGNDYLVEIPEAWIADAFNLVGLDALIPMYSQCLDMILDLESDPLYGKFCCNEDNDIGNDVIESNAQILYALIHQRFITTRSGLSVYKERLLEGEFGSCPRVGCHGSFLIPCGQSNLPGI